MTEENFRTYDKVGALIIGIILLVALLSSCATTRTSNYQDHLRTTPVQNWVRHDNGGCGWNH